MKCIRMDGKLHRVSDDVARALVREGKAVFVPKREYKDSMKTED